MGNIMPSKLDRLAFDKDIRNIHLSSLMYRKRNYDQPRHVYIIASLDAERVKIGISVDPSKRLVAIQTGNHERLALLFSVLLPERTAFGIEAKMHKKLRKSVFSGKGEWFSMSADIAYYELIATVRESMGASFRFKAFAWKDGKKIDITKNI